MIKLIAGTICFHFCDELHGTSCMRRVLLDSNKTPGFLQNLVFASNPNFRNSFQVFINFAREQADEDINILREPLCQHKRTLSGVSDIGSLASESEAEQEFVSLAPNHDFQNNPRSPPPTQVIAPNTFLVSPSFSYIHASFFWH